MNKITYCIPSKNNLRYLKNSLSSIKKNSKIDHDVLVFVDSDNDGTEEWLKKEGVKYIKNQDPDPKGIAYAYNRCIDIAETEIVCMFHADMYMANGFDLNALKHLERKVVVSATRIEPPLHPEGKEKIVKNFGMYPEDFLEREFNDFVEQQKVENANKVTYGIFAPWMCYKSELIEIGLHDEIFHSYHEDSDIFNRMILNGMKCVQSRDSFVYHLTCRGGQFQDGIEKITVDEKFHAMKRSAQRNYLRKWGTWIKNDEYQHPIVPKVYDVAFKVKNCSLQYMEFLEPWCKTIYADTDTELVDRYISLEQPSSIVDLREKIKTYDSEQDNRTTVEFDASSINNDRYSNFVCKIEEVLDQVTEEGIYEWDVFRITVRDPRPIGVKNAV
jgi:glycosyltransferase involved in cell wall biosynthesis